MRKNRILSSQLAFTIIELLFVIAILGVIASFGVSLYRREAESTKIDKAALTIQQMLQGADYFYSSQNPHVWPDEGVVASSANCGEAAAPELCSYVPMGTASWNNPWGAHYSWRVMSTGTQKFFQVITQTPLAATAIKLAAKLPSASVNGNEVTVTLGPPVTKEGEYYIGGYGTVAFPETKGSLLNFERCVPYDCAFGTNPQLLAWIQEVQTSGRAGGYGTHHFFYNIYVGNPGYTDKSTTVPTAPQFCLTSDNKPGMMLQGFVKSTGGESTIAASYLILCEVRG